MIKLFKVSGKGCSISCKLYYSDIKILKKVIIFGHGFGGHKDNKAAERFANYVMKKHKDIGILTYNAPCHGDDVKKKLTLEDCSIYIENVTDYAKNRFKADELYVYGTSFGGYQFLKYIAENGNPYKKIALRCPAVNMYQTLSSGIMDEKELKALSRNKPVLVGFDRKIRVTQSFLNELKEADICKMDFSKYSSDILIIQGTKDQVVDHNIVEDFAHKNNIAFTAVEGADHRFKNPDYMDEAVKAIVEFFGI